MVEAWSWKGLGGVPNKWASRAGLYFVWQQPAVERKDTVLDVRELRTGAAAARDDAEAEAAVVAAAVVIR